MARLISPASDLIEELLTDNEASVFQRLDRDLPEDCAIFIKPQFNGLSPDLVILSPVGVMPVLVYDWDLGSSFTPLTRRAAVAQSHNGREILHASPIERLRLLRQQILDLFCARSRMPLRQLEVLVCAAVIFPETTTLNALEFCRRISQVKKPWGTSLWNGTNSSVRILGGDGLDDNAIEFLVPLAQSWRSKYQSELVYEDVKSWLVEPEQRALNREPLELDIDQRRLVETSSAPRYRRIRGPAGSGKSLVLAARAQELCQRGASVLVVNYNITLIRWLQGYADRWAINSKTKKTDLVPEYHNFHELLKVICCLWSTYAMEYYQIWKDSRSVSEATKELVKLARQVINETPGIAGRFDAVLVDEGQDFLPEWWQIVRALCRDDGERLLTSDSTQDIYKRSSAWTDEAMNGAGFTGRWIELGISYRLPETVADFALAFAEKYLPERQVIKPQKSLQQGFDYGDCYINWLDCEYVGDQEYLDTVAAQVSSMVENLEDGGSWADITVIVTSRDFGYALSQSLKRYKIESINTFGGPVSKGASIEQEQLERRKKQAFTLVADKVKVTTINSAKGLEARGIVVALGRSASEELASLAYTAITRVKASSRGSALVIVNSVNRFVGAASLITE